MRRARHLLPAAVLSVPLWTGLVFAQTASPPAAMSVKDVLSAPFMNQLTAAPAKNRVAWFVDAEGVRNVWVASPTEKARAITHNTEDDGQDISDITWSPDAEAVAYTHGTGPEGSEHPTAANPAQLQGDVKQRVEIASLAGVVRVIGEGHSPVFSIDGKRIFFLAHGHAMIADVSDTAGKPQELIVAKGIASQLRPSPDGLKLAFVSKRDDHSFIGVFTFATSKQTASQRGTPAQAQHTERGSSPADPGRTEGALYTSPGQSPGSITPNDLRAEGPRYSNSQETKGTLTYVDPGTGLDHDPAWSADSKRIAFIRESPVATELNLRWMRSGVPWSIRIADVANGAGTEAWRADEGTGSLFHEMSAKNQLLWMADNRIVFPWEKTGWLHLYSLAPSEKTAKLLSQGGDYEVDTVISDGKRVIYSGNFAGDVVGEQERRHLYAEANSPDSLTPLTGDVRAIETNAAILSDGMVAAMQGSAYAPFAPVLLPAKISLRICPEQKLTCAPGTPLSSKPTAPNFSFVEPEAVAYKTSDGLTIDAQLFLPKNVKPGTKLPAVVFFHGGSRRQMLLGYNPMEYYAQAYEFNQLLAAHGYAVLSVNYRSGTGYGMEFRQAKNYGVFGASEYADVKGAALYLASRNDIDAKRIGAWGGSYGGYLTALALARNSDLFAAGVDLHGVHDYAMEMELEKPNNDPTVDAKAMQHTAWLASPLADVKTWRSPVLLIQGDDDRNVMFSNTVRLAAALRAQNTPVEELIFPDEVHEFLLHKNWVAAYTAALDFFDRKLKAK